METSQTVIKELEAKIHSIPALPSVLKELNEHLSQSEPDINRMVHLMQMDAGLSMRLLRIANSSFYGFQREISNLEQAVVLLGLSELTNLINGLVLMDQARKIPVWSVLDERKYWRYNVALTSIVRYLSIQLQNSELEMNGPTVAIMQQLGVCALAYSFPEEYTKILNAGGDLSEIELLMLGVDHRSAAAILCRHWQLPEAIVDAVEARSDTADKQLNDLVSLAKVLAQSLGYSMGNYYSEQVDIEQLMQSLGMEKRSFQALWHHFPMVISETVQAYSSVDTDHQVVDPDTTTLLAYVSVNDPMVAFQLSLLLSSLGVEYRQTSGNIDMTVILSCFELPEDGQSNDESTSSVVDLSKFVENNLSRAKTVNWLQIRQSLLEKTEKLRLNSPVDIDHRANLH